MRGIALAICLVIALAGCSSEPTLNEYAESVETLTTALYSKLDSLTAEIATRYPAPAVPTVTDIQVLYADVATAYRSFRDGLEAIDPPDETEELHEKSIEIMDRLTAAEEAFARLTLQFDEDDDLDLLWASPEFQAANSAQDEIIAFCQDAQARFDATADREVYKDVPWIPSEMQEVVLVAFGCDREFGGDDS